MGSPRWGNRSITTAHEQALVFCADFAALCFRQGDLKNAYRWKCVLNENRLRSQDLVRVLAANSVKVLQSRNVQAQLPLM